mgnify:CR=1 FL=1
MTGFSWVLTAGVGVVYAFCLCKSGGEIDSSRRRPGHFFRYTFNPTFSSRFGMVTFPSVEAIMIVFPDAEGPNSLDRSTLIVNIVPSTVISTFFMIVAFQ